MLRAVVNALASEHESAVAGDRDPGDANVAANRATVLKGEDALYAADVALVEQLAHPLPARWPHTVRPQSAGRTRGGVASSQDSAGDERCRTRRGLVGLSQTRRACAALAPR